MDPVFGAGLIARTRAEEPPNEAALRGIESRSCAICGAYVPEDIPRERDGSLLCDGCLETRTKGEERAHALADLMRRHGVSKVEDLPKSVMMAFVREWGSGY